jgi:hypothetical protein
LATVRGQGPHGENGDKQVGVTRKADFAHGQFSPLAVGLNFATYAFSRRPLSRAFRPFIERDLKVCKGSRNYGDRDKGLAPLSLRESR